MTGHGEARALAALDRIDDGLPPSVQDRAVADVFDRHCSDTWHHAERLDAFLAEPPAGGAEWVGMADDADGAA